MDTPITVSIQLAHLGATLTILGVILRQHKVWVRMKDRMTVVWKKHCRETGDEYIPLDNGH